MKAVIYSRCSTDEDRQDVDAQLDKCIKYCNAQEWPYEIVREYSSAWNKPRPIFEALLVRISSGEFNVLVCFDMDRFSRDDPHIADRYLNKVVHECGCRFISLNDGIDSSDDVKWHIVRHIMVWQANKYSQKLSARIKEGIKNKRKKLGDAYKHGIGRKANYDKIKELYERGLSISEIARRTNANKGSVFYAIKKIKELKEE